MPDAEMPKYKCRRTDEVLREVWALKIAKIVVPEIPLEQESDISRIIVPEEEGYAEFGVDASYVKTHNPQAGGYYVVYKNGYGTFIPAKAFEEGYDAIS